MASGLVGIMGLKRSGKDTYAARLVSHHGFTRYALADPMREAALGLDPYVLDPSRSNPVRRLSEVVAEYGWETAKETIPEVRRTLQRLGTEAGRDVLGEDVWIQATARKVHATPGPVVITDVRFPNEYEWIKEQGGILLRVIRPGLVPDSHVSEQMATDEFRYPAKITVANAGSIEDLHHHADTVGRCFEPDLTLF